MATRRAAAAPATAFVVDVYDEVAAPLDARVGSEAARERVLRAMAALVPTMDDEAVETHLQLGKPWQKLDAGADLIALLRSRQGEGPKTDRDAPAILSEVMAAFAADPTKVPQQLAKWNVMDKKLLLTEPCRSRAPLADQHSAEARLRQQLVHKIASNKTVPRDAPMKIWSDARKAPQRR